MKRRRFLKFLGALLVGGRALEHKIPNGERRAPRKNGRGIWVNLGVDTTRWDRGVEDLERTLGGILIPEKHAKELWRLAERKKR